MAAIAVALSIFISSTLRSDAIEGLVDEAVGSSSARLLRAITPADLEQPMTGARYDEVHRFVQDFVLSERTARVKVWARDGTVTYSPDPAGVGEGFPQNENLLKALRRENAVKLHITEDPEHRREGEVGDLMEVYTPILFPGSTEPQGAFEVHQYYGPIARRINNINRWLYWAIGVGFAVLYASLFFGVRRGWIAIRTREGERARFARRLEQQVAALEEAYQVLYQWMEKAGQEVAALVEQVRAQRMRLPGDTGELLAGDGGEAVGAA